jgi:DNA-binding FrmR family transcriptional regulator
MLPETKTQALNRLKTVRGHLEGVIRMVENDAYCVEIMKQVSALQSSLERVNRLVFKNHLETCFSQAVVEGRGPQAIAELLDAVKFSPVLTGPEGVLGGSAVGEPQAAPGAGAVEASPPVGAGGGGTRGRH